MVLKPMPLSLTRTSVKKSVQNWGLPTMLSLLSIWRDFIFSKTISVCCAKLLAKNHDSYLVLVGDGLVGNKQIEDAIDELGIRSNVKIMGFRTDSCALYSAADVTVLPSLSEGFPNVVGESMLCERPCITSTVGDCANITGHSDWAFELSDENGFAEKLFEFSKTPKTELKVCGKECRKRIVDNFGIEKIYNEYAKIWRE